ncbi:MAG: hypothetical protein IIC36_15535, partial [Gemmatimonadetes bacterium]|nr:hypothetical protein [Gemmatimonadota bacterium]
MRTTWTTLMMGALALLLVAAPLVAHHVFSAEFDRNAPIRLTGPVVRLEWLNPHSSIHLEITNLDGTKDVWVVEAGSPYVLQRRGLRRECLGIGTVLTVDGDKVQREVIRAGVFSVISEGEYLVWDTEIQTIRELNRQPPARYLETVAPYQENDEGGFAVLAIDPSRGSLLIALLDSPSPTERVQ